MATRKTRGPRTASERARDAARSAATLLERTVDDECHAIATMLRFQYQYDWLDPRNVEAAAGARHLLSDKWSILDELDAGAEEGGRRRSARGDRRGARRAGSVAWRHSWARLSPSDHSSS